ncbi:hypothetical protein [Streptomyces alboflavus]|uniref:hypothetical protein n=1 Tax=Streptomyces alboflavus TaxID=67267 RepID=UPI000F6585FD|nr:hypothetical protein [Streptomyces alboflavus]
MNNFELRTFLHTALIGNAGILPENVLSVEPLPVKPGHTSQLRVKTPSYRGEIRTFLISITEECGRDAR